MSGKTFFFTSSLKTSKLIFRNWKVYCNHEGYWIFGLLPFCSDEKNDFFSSSKKLLRLLKWTSCEECLMIYPCSFSKILLNLFRTEKILFNAVYFIKLFDDFPKFLEYSAHFFTLKMMLKIPCTLYIKGSWERVLDSFYDE
jgi:hypothetical protein